MIPANIEDYRILAKKRLPKFLFEYIDGGAFSETTLRKNSSDFQDIRVRQRVLRDISSVDTSCTLFGEKYNLPLILGPVGIAGLNARRGEVLAAQAAEEKKVPFCLSTVGVCTIDEVRKSVEKPIWFQLYMIKDRGFLNSVLESAREAGTQNLVFTVDMPIPSSRYRDIRSGLSGGSMLRRQCARVFQSMIRPAWAWDVGLLGRPHNLGTVAPALGQNAGIDEFWTWMNKNFDPSVTWKTLETIRENWKGNLIIKGILDPQDALEAKKLGADGVIVSNHGGRQLDGAMSAITALPDIVDTLQGDIPSILDGGVRTGLDIVRAVAMGASSVMIGRPWVYGLSARKKAGVMEVISILENEMRVAMGLSGNTKISELNRDMLL
ncbi:L-lactate dehydrogenase [Teredinibacter franksiae]|uniref:L-lactate dehydrogenase n=1 Tax=Teredinibacter franksiae TaxID=2761453 RepID=UPI0016290D56|nr:L-lactate dehydrogenase [Teredinibacter franksiae]